MKRFALLLKISMRNVFRNRRHSLYALGTIAMGAMGLLVFMGFNRGTMNEYRGNTIRSRWGHGQLFTLGYHGKAHARPWDKWIENPNLVMDRLRGLPGVLEVFPRVTVHAMVTANGHAVVGQGEGIDGVKEPKFFTRLNYLEGGDFKERGWGIILGEGVARGLGVKVGDEIKLIARDTKMAVREHSATVTGVFQTGSQEFDSRAFRIPLKVAQNLLGTKGVESISVALSGINGWQGFSDEVKKIAPQLDAIPFDELDKVYYGHAVVWLDAQFAFIRGIILLMVFFGIFNAISMTVLERTAEIGMLRANGESRLEIALGHVIETLALSLLGCGLGLVGSWVLSVGPLSDGIAMPPAPGLTRGLRTFIEIEFGDVIQLILLCMATSLAGSLFPIWRVTHISIPEALRHV